MDKLNLTCVESVYQFTFIRNRINRSDVNIYNIYFYLIASIPESEECATICLTAVLAPERSWLKIICINAGERICWMISVFSDGKS